MSNPFKHPPFLQKKDILISDDIKNENKKETFSLER